MSQHPSTLPRITSALLLLLQILMGSMPPDARSLTRSQTGRWAPARVTPETQVHMVLLPGYGSAYHSRVMWFCGVGHHERLYGNVLGWTAGEYDCSSYPEARLDSGTQSGTENGMRHAFTYNPVADTWTRIDSMDYYRWYPTATTLADGTVLTVAGTSCLQIHSMYGRRNTETRPVDPRIFRLDLQYNGMRDDPVSTFTYQGGINAPPQAREGAAATYTFGAYAMALSGGRRGWPRRDDLVGRRIHTLADAAFPPGEHVLRWDGKTQGGRAAPGIYWYRLTTPSHRAQRRMILLP